jgi:hypothetical protein
MWEKLKKPVKNGEKPERTGSNEYTRSKKKLRENDLLSI